MDALANRTVEGRKTLTVLFCDLVAYTELAGPERGLIAMRSAAEL